ncbi:MAG: lysostaphin resistance A-like protein [Candidatus Heimdallarchaeota archaeon]
MYESKLKILYSTCFFFVIYVTLVYNLQYIAEVILLDESPLIEWDSITVTAAKFAIIGLTSFICTFAFIKWQGIKLESLALKLEVQKISIYIVVGAILGISALLSTVAIEIIGDIARERGAKLDSNELALLVAFQLFFVGPGEELIFRGYIQGEAEKIYRPFEAILFSACAFGLIHVLFFVSINPESAAIIFVSSAIAGIGFGYARQVSGNLAYPIALHGFWNAFAFIMQIEYVWGYDPKEVGFIEFIIESVATMTGIGLIILITFLLARYTHVFEDTKPFTPPNSAPVHIQD